MKSQRKSLSTTTLTTLGMSKLYIPNSATTIIRERCIIMDKRAQGLPITTIILAILGLVVLVILFAVLTGRLTIFTGAVNECSGICVIDVQTKYVSKAAPGSPLEVREKAPCTEFESRIYGNFIARGVRGDEKEPISCESCCQRLA